MRRLATAAAALALLAVAAPARAQERQAGVGSFEFQAGPYRPLVDSEFTLPPGTQGPWASSFGDSRRWLFKLHGAKALVHGQGTLELGLGAGYMSASGNARFADGTKSQEKTGFKLVPISLDLTYRADQVWEQLSIPVVPFVRLGLLHDMWWVTGAGGSTSKTGATNGWSWGGGLGLVLDGVDPTLSRELDRDSGIKHTMLVFEVAKTKVNDFGSSRSWNLSNDGVLMTFGLLFAF
jgi:hypothetical protein